MARVRRGGSVRYSLAALAVLAIGLGIWRATSTAEPTLHGAAPEPARDGGSDAPRAPELVREAVAAEPAPAPASSELERERPPRDDLFALLAWLEVEGHGPVPEIVTDAPGFANLFARREREIWVDAKPYLKELGNHLKAGAEVAFDPGLWRIEGLDPRGLRWPPDVTLCGGGKTTTLFVLGALQPAGNVERLTIRDCTVFTEGRALLDVPAAYVGLTLERVRVVGWDGAARTPLVRARGLGVRMVDCELVGGFGRAAGSGTLFEVAGDALVARLERCRLSDLDPGLEAWTAATSAAFVECASSGLPGDPRALLGDRPGLVFESSTFALRDAGQALGLRPLDELFPAWERKIR